jgi:hypothetical protein
VGCPFSTPTTLIVEGVGFLTYAPNNFSVCLGPWRVIAPFQGQVIDDGTLTVTTSQQFYSGVSQWGGKNNSMQWNYVSLCL